MSDHDINECAKEDPCAAVMLYSQRVGVMNLAAKFVGVCWEQKVDDAWWFAINPNRHPVKVSTGIEVGPFCLYVEYNGWPAGMLSFGSGGEFAMGTGANPETFYRALMAAAERKAGES